MRSIPTVGARRGARPCRRRGQVRARGKAGRLLPRRSHGTRAGTQHVARSGGRMRVVFVTPNQGRQAEVRRLLADVDVELSRLGPTVPDGLDLEDTARARAAGAFAQLGRPCFVENTL